MNFSLLYIIFLLILFINNIHAHFSPSVAFFENLPAMYKTDKGWVVNENFKVKITNHSEIVAFCKEVYPTYNIINAVPSFKKVMITNWCPTKDVCTAKDEHEIHPIECINSSFVSKSILIPSYCKFHIDQTGGCLPFHIWKQRAKTSCVESGQELYDLQVIFPCKNKYMVFSESEFMCCSNKDEVSRYSVALRNKLDVILQKYIPILEKYQDNKKSHIEHQLFSVTKGALHQKYTSSLNFLNKEVRGNLKIIMKENGLMTSQKYKNEENKLFTTYKHNYESLTHEFKRGIFYLDNIHIKRIIKKSDNICHTKNNTDSDPSKCLNELNTANKRIIEHFKKMVRIPGLDFKEYLVFIKSKLKHLYSRYLPLTHGNKIWSKRFNDQLEKYRLKYESSHIPSNKSLDVFIRHKFDHFKRDTIEFLHYREHYLSLAPMIGIIVIVVFAFVVVISILLYKYWNYHHRRGHHNYVMRVVGEPEQTSQSINRPEMTLNLYENPIFNSKSVAKPIEKRSLIENMEN